ncbi:MAG: LURP-one-related family protein [Christensenellaceae bacterium]|jgi:uncharacterized protein YxjI|nr:LURP-one-related family protein [Christensenellaceae bacterium]
MKLYIRQKAFSWRDRFAVWDESGKECYYARGEIFSLGRRLHISDASGREVAHIRAKLFSFLPRYFIEIGGASYALKKEFTLFRPAFTLEGLPFTMAGDFWAHEYEMRAGDALVMRLSKQWFTWGDAYELEIAAPGDAPLCLCAALAVDCMQADANSR